MTINQNHKIKDSFHSNFLFVLGFLSLFKVSLGQLQRGNNLRNEIRVVKEFIPNQITISLQLNFTILI